VEPTRSAIQGKLIEKGKEFVNKWIGYCTFKFGAQREGVPGASLSPIIQKTGNKTGVCESMCIDWIRRKKRPSTSGEPKDSFSTSKHPTKPHAERMERKILGNHEKRGYARMQEMYGVTTILKEDASDVEKKQAFLAWLSDVSPKFRGLQVRAVGSGRSKIMQGTRGSAVFGAIILACEEARKNEEVLNLDPLSPCYKLSFYDQEGRPSHSMALQITHLPATAETDHGAWPVTKGQTGSAIGRIHFLDPSLGEYQFLSPAVEDLFYRFCDDMWELNYLIFKNEADIVWGAWQAFQYYWL
jgi:hypothetical protein